MVTSLHLAMFVHAASVWFMAGVIWLVQCVLYPLFLYVDPQRFVAFHAQHVNRITYVVGPMMLIELCSAACLLWVRPDALTITLLTLSVVCFALTAWVSVPLHTALSTGFDAALCHRLIATNGLRTAAWTVHALATIGLCWPAGR
jgi:hypothetical protein